MAVIQKEVMRRLKEGETLLCSLPVGDSATDRPVYFLSGGGRVTTATYHKLTSEMEAVSPGLFEDLEPQEWRWVER
ncbi:hypothetical protein [Shimia sagamensis]|uniref:Uncharacterized protein n=1 Tax=Shimia sagamensis TaxID=1566352 RepID=A0ABY1PKU9_9RHOB|nr:hypothetical protein [Shimia sagamensis]SMP36419.1 hypothetical protein SAMN06265373_11618 [Shimia sagamensis]